MTNERFEAVLSKELEIQSKKEISKYIGLVSDDILQEMDEEDRNQNPITFAHYEWWSLASYVINSKTVESRSRK